MTDQVTSDIDDGGYGAVVAELRKAASVRDHHPDYLSDVKVKEMATAILQYCEIQSGITMYWYQRDTAYRIIYSLISEDGEEITALFARQSGKTELVGDVVAGLCVILPLLAEQVKDPRIQKFKEGFWVGLFAPSYYTAGILGNRIRQRMLSEHARNIIEDDIGLETPKKNRTRLALENGSRVETISAKTNTTIEGETFHLLVLEETQDLDSTLIRKSIHPMGAATLATMVKIGTPNMMKSEFYQACRRNRRRDIGKKLENRNHFEFDYMTAAKENPRYAKYVEQEVHRLGFQSDEFRMSYRLHWLLERGVFITEEMFAECGLTRRRKLIRRKGAVVEATYTLPHHTTNYDEKRRCTAGIDFGKTEAATVVTVTAVNFEMPMQVDGQLRYHKHVLDWLEIKGDDYEDQLPRIVDFLGNYPNLEIVCADATGPGDPLTSRLKNILSQRRVRVIPFVFTGKSKDLGYRLFLQELTAGRFTWPMSVKTMRMRKFQNFQTQFYSLTKKYQGSRMVVEKPNNEKGVHDDYPDSAMLANWAATARVLTTATQQDYNIFFNRGERIVGRRRNELMTRSRERRQRYGAEAFGRN